MNQMIYDALHFPDIICNYFTLKRKHVNIGKNLKINGRIHIHGKGNIVIGDDVVINCSSNVNPIGGHGTHFQVIGKGRISIGNRCGLSHVFITSACEVIIENDVLIGSDCRIYDTDFHSIDFNKRIDKTGIRTSGITIEEGAFIGTGSIILKGVTIGKHSVVGAGSVVTHDIPQDEVWAGNPAKKIRKMVNDNNGNKG